ncbi:MAG: stage V sporulation protein AB [Lachnospiraceae bacterium]|nr:stage V sporulation protein AB [Lachnospiraceae bacterium]
MSDGIRIALYYFTGISFGVAVAAGLFAFITTVGVVTRLAAGTKTAKHTMLYETIAIFGVTLANGLDIFRWEIFCGTLCRTAGGFFSGVFVGCLAAALAEVVNVFPVMIRRIRIKVGLPYIVLAFAVGKGFGSWYQLILGAGK